MSTPESKIDIAGAFAEASRGSSGDLHPFAYVNSLQYSLKNFRFELTTSNRNFQDATFFASFVLHSLEIVKFITFNIAQQIRNVEHPLDKDELASFALFQSKNWFLIGLLTKNSVQVNSELFLDHISEIEEVLSLWEGFILKNQIRCFQ